MVYEVDGAGPPLLLLHAGVADRRMWAGVIAPLARRYQVVTCDLRGYGESLLPDGAFAYTDDLRALLDRLDLRRVWVAGVSFGARVAVDFVLAHPERVQGLILVSPTVDGFAPDEALQRFGDEEEALLEAGDLEAATQLNVGMWMVGPHRDPAQVDVTLREQAAAMQRAAFDQPYPAGVSLRRPEVQAVERLDQIHCPTLVLYGTLDLRLFVLYAREVAEQVHAARLVAFDGVAHLVPMEAPARFVHEVVGFIGRHPATHMAG